MISTSAFAAVLTMQTATEREDGSPLGLSEIKGHNIYCGTSTGAYGNANFVAGAQLPDTVVDPIPGIVLGTNYCVVTTVDIDGRESVYSNEFQVVATKSNPKQPMIPAGLIINTTL